MTAGLPLPRYTSYPPASLFSPHVGEAALRAAITTGNGDPIPRELSFYVHVPFCTSPCFYCGCNRIITRDRSRGAAYVARLEREFDLLAQLVDRDRRGVQLHLGGGTPNFLDAASIGDVVGALRSQFHLSESGQRDFSIEIDPRAATAADIEAYARAGFNRVSIGVQDLDPAVQATINRKQSPESIRELVDACRSAGMVSVGMDLILGLPRQEPEGLARTLQAVIAMRPDRLAVYSYAHLPARFPAQRRLTAAGVPSPAAARKLRRLADERLAAAGYLTIGFDHYALPTDRLATALSHGGLHRNFMGYSIHAECDLLGFGISAISHVGDCYSQNTSDLTAWERAIDAGRLPACRGWLLTDDDRVRADVIQQLLCRSRVDIGEVERRHGIEFAGYFAAALRRLAPFVDRGELAVSARGLVVDSRARESLRRIAACFDRYQQVPGRRPTTATNSASVRPVRSPRPACRKASTRAR